MEIIRESGSKQVGGGSAGGREISMEIIRETGGSTTQVKVLVLYSSPGTWFFAQVQVPCVFLKSKYLVLYSSPGNGASLKCRYWCFIQVQVPSVFLKYQVLVLYSTPGIGAFLRFRYLLLLLNSSTSTNSSPGTGTFQVLVHHSSTGY